MSAIVGRKSFRFDLRVEFEARSRRHTKQRPVGRFSSKTSKRCIRAHADEIRQNIIRGFLCAISAATDFNGLLSLFRVFSLSVDFAIKACESGRGVCGGYGGSRKKRPSESFLPRPTPPYRNSAPFGTCWARLDLPTNGFYLRLSLIALRSKACRLFLVGGCICMSLACGVLLSVEYQV